MLELFKAWVRAVFVTPRVRIAFWGLVSVVLTVQMPAVPDLVIPQWIKIAMGVASGVMIPHFQELILAQLAAAGDTGAKPPEGK